MEIVEVMGLKESFFKKEEKLNLKELEEVREEMKREWNGEVKEMFKKNVFVKDEKKIENKVGEFNYS